MRLLNEKEGISLFKKILLSSYKDMDDTNDEAFQWMYPHDFDKHI
jgi:hypothetical protein